MPDDLGAFTVDFFFDLGFTAGQDYLFILSQSVGGRKREIPWPRKTT